MPTPQTIVHQAGATVCDGRDVPVEHTTHVLDEITCRRCINRIISRGLEHRPERAS